MSISFLYDKQDSIFLEQVNKTIEYNRKKDFDKQFLMHPNGIVDLTTKQELRMASAVLSLLDTLQTRNAAERLFALENLHNEVLLSARTKFRRNTARVLIEIMKEIVRSYGNEDLQIKLVHDFRMAAKGNTGIVRKLLKKYYLLEMPETWNQLVFDHHVHDANTKGRKSPTHLIMDAWVKGISSLTVIYYHYITPEAAEELIRASAIVGIKTRIGILYNLIYRHNSLDFIWIPRSSTTDYVAFRSFLEEPHMQRLHKEGIAFSKWKEKFTLKIIEEWNISLRYKVAKEFEIPLTELTEKEFFDFVGEGQCSVLHLSELIHKKAFSDIQKRADELFEMYDKEEDSKKKTNYLNTINMLDMLTPEYFLEILEDCAHIQEKCLVAESIVAKNLVSSPENNKSEEGEKDEDIFDLTSTLQGSPADFLNRLNIISPGAYITLNLANVTPEDVLTLLWECKGLVSHLEIFNVYDWHNGNSPYTLEINDLMEAINRENTPNLKQIIQGLIQAVEEEDEKSFFDMYTNHSKHKALLDETKKNTLLLSSKVKKVEPEKQKIMEHDGEMLIASSQDTVLHEKCENIEETYEEVLFEKSQKLETDNETHIDDNITAVEHFCDLSSASKFLSLYKEDPRFSLISKEERIEKLRLILRNIVTLIGFYQGRKLHTRMGTDSTSRVGRLAGMGLAYVETLTKRAVKELRKSKNVSRLLLPVRKEVKEVIKYDIPYANERLSSFTKILRAIPLLSHLTYHKTKSFEDFDAHTSVINNGECCEACGNFKSDSGNIITLGGVGIRSTNRLINDNNKPKNEDIHTNPINTNVLNVLKVFIGFIPAFFCFQHTQEIPLLAWGGALIWFFITGIRNIIQAVLGGGGLQRSPLMRWNNYVSWSRLADSLMYTGLSVVLLELLVRNYLLGYLGLSSVNAPILTFSIISIINGCYIVCHNLIRGLQAEAIAGNFFRSFFAIPLSLIYNGIFTTILVVLNVDNIDAILLSSSAILSKISSDTVAGIIEGWADKGSNLWLRRYDYELASKEMYSNFSMLELEFPENNVLNMLSDPENMLKELHKNPVLYNKIIINSLDFMYLYYYQPRAHTCLKEIVRHLSDMERLSWLRIQYVLKCKKEVSQLFIDGIINENFSSALAFYLKKHEEYLRDMEVIYRIKTS